MRPMLWTYSLVKTVPAAGPGTSEAVVGSGTCCACALVNVTAHTSAAARSRGVFIFIILFFLWLIGSLVKSRAAHSDSPRVSQSNHFTLLRLVPLVSPGGFFLEVEILGFLDGNADAEDRPAVELPRRFVFLGDGVAAVVADAEAVTREGELAHLRAHRTFRHDLVVHIELGGAQRLMIRAGFLPGEL